MNFDEDLKRQLDQTPGMGFSKFHREAVLARVRELPAPAGLERPMGAGSVSGAGGTGGLGAQGTASPTGTGAGGGSARSTGGKRPPPRWKRGLRWTSAAIAACVLVAGGVAAYLHQPKQTTEATKKLNKPPVSNPTAPASGESSTSTLVAQPHASSILLADGTSLMPSHPVNVPQMPSGPALTAVPVVQIPVQAAVTMPAVKMQVPTTLDMPVPQALAAKVTAYFFRLGNNNSFYLLGPAGLKGTCQAAADGSLGILLQGHGMTLSLMTYGGSLPIAEGQAAPLIEQARLDYQSQMGMNVAPLAHADLAQIASDTTAFGFDTKSGSRVFGFDVFHNDNGPGGVFYLGGQEVLKTTVPTEEFTTLAPWILANGIAVVSQASTSSGPLWVVSQKGTLNGHTYTVDEPMGSNLASNVISTPSGVVWWQEPALEVNGTGQLSAYPTQPYTLYLSPADSQFLTPGSAKPLLTLPYFKGSSANGNELFAYGGTLTSIQNWVVFPVSYRSIGMNQPAGNDLHALNLQTGKDTVITSFAAGGGMFFLWGSYSHYIIYDQQGPNAQGGFSHNLNLYDLATGTDTKLPASDIVAGSTSMVQVTLNGQSVKVSLNQG